MTLKQLEYFLEIAKMGSVTRAAQSLNVSQPPVSLQLKLLEEELGSPLFIRDKRHLEITPAGTLLRERAKAILALLEETSRDIQLISQERHMLIRIATIGSINSQILPEKIAHFCSAYPYVNFQVVEGRTESVLAALRENEADIGFVREPFNVTAFHVVPIRNTLLPPGEADHFVALAKPYFFEGSSSDAIPLEDLQGKPLVTHRRYREMLVTACRKHGFTPHIICENDGIQSSLSWAQAGIGIAIAPYTSAIINTDSSLVIRHLEDLNFSPRVCLIWNQNKKLFSEINAFINLF